VRERSVNAADHRIDAGRRSWAVDGDTLVLSHESRRWPNGLLSNAIPSHPGCAQGRTRVDWKASVRNWPAAPEAAAEPESVRPFPRSADDEKRHLAEAGNDTRRSPNGATRRRARAELAAERRARAVSPEADDFSSGSGRGEASPCMNIRERMCRDRTRDCRWSG